MKTCADCDSDVMNDFPDHECKKCVERLRAENAELRLQLAELTDGQVFTNKAQRELCAACSHIRDDNSECPCPEAETIIDPATGLMWETSRGENLTWPEAVKRPEQLNTVKYGGFDDWRVPTIDELEVLMKHNLFPKEGWYWSSSPYDTSLAWRAHFGNGNVLNYLVNNDYYVRCVRSGP